MENGSGPYSIRSSHDCLSGLERHSKSLVSGRASEAAGPQTVQADIAPSSPRSGL